MSLDFATKDLYGGAITISLPTDVLDASTIRQIPDHQEVFLSNSTLTSIIIEINEYQHPSDVTLSNPHNNNNDDPNRSAATHHLTDTLTPPDHFSPTGINTTRTTLARPSLSKYPAYVSTATIITPELDRAQKSILPLAWQTNPAQKEQLVCVLQLLVRMEDVEVDLCVRINVPLKEFDEGAAEGELSIGREVLEGVVGSLDVADFGLFGGT